MNTLEEDSNSFVFSHDQKIRETSLAVAAISRGTEVIIGDGGGNMRSFQFSNESNKLVPCQSAFLAKARIDEIVSHPNNTKNIIYVLCNGMVSIMLSPKLSKEDTIKRDKDSIEKIAVNKFDTPDYENQILVITKKKKVRIYEISKVENKYRATEVNLAKDIQVEEIPESFIWVGDNLLYCYKRQKMICLEISTGKSRELMCDKPSKIFFVDSTCATYSEDSNLILIYNEAEAPDCIGNPPPGLISMEKYKGYYVCLHNDGLHLLQKVDKSLKEVERNLITEKYPNDVCKYCLTNQTFIILLSINIQAPNTVSVCFFKEKPYEQQIENLLRAKQFNKALKILGENILNEDDRKEQIESFFLNCAWTSFLDKDFENAYNYAILTNFNPFQFMYLYYLQLGIENIVYDSEIARNIKDSPGRNILEKFDANTLKESYKFLIKIFLAKRDYLLQKHEFPKENYKDISFLNSPISPIQLPNNAKIPIQDTFTEMNKVLLKCMILASSSAKEIIGVLDSGAFSTKGFENFENSAFFSGAAEDGNSIFNKIESKFTLAYLAEKQGKYETALQTWSEFGKDEIPGEKEKVNVFKYQAKERTKKIFYIFKEDREIDHGRKEELFRKYIVWLLEESPEEAFEVAVKTEIVSIKTFMDLIISKVEDEMIYKDQMIGLPEKEKGFLKLRFLEFMNKTQPTEEYQTELIETLLAKIFNLHKEIEGGVGGKEEELAKLMQHILTLLKAKDALYRRQDILKEVENSWFFEAKYCLYSQLGEHEKAIEEMFKVPSTTFDEGDLKKIEEYLDENRPNRPDIYQIYYRILAENLHQKSTKIDEINKQIEAEKEKMQERKRNKELILMGESGIYNKFINEKNNEINKYNMLKEPVERIMFKILTEHGSFDDMDPEFALENADENWDICGDNNQLFFDYLIDVVKRYTVQGNKYKLGKNLSEMSLTYKEQESFDYKQKSIVIDSEKTCDLCKKKLATANNMTPFVIYPNFKVFHSRCAPNLNIDPTTGVDFSKKSMI